MKPSKIHISIERAKPEDGPSILQLLSAAQLPVDGLIDHLHSAVIARADGGGVVGCAALEIYADGALLRSVVVDEGAHGQGIGTRLTTGSVIGTGANVFATSMTPKVVAPFSWGGGADAPVYEVDKRRRIPAAERDRDRIGRKAGRLGVRVQV